MMSNTSGQNIESVADRIKTIEEIEKKITLAIGSAGMALQELSKDKPNDRHMDKATSTFLQSLDEAETHLAAQINYLSQVATNQQHEGSCYAARKKAQLVHESIAQLSRQVDEMISTCQQGS